MVNVGFNPRSHAGSDSERYVRKRVEIVSIHAPTRGATHMPDTAYL